MMMHLREELSQELFSVDLCDEGYAGKRMSLADTQHQSPDVGASWRPLWDLNNSLIPESSIPMKSAEPNTLLSMVSISYSQSPEKHRQLFLEVGKASHQDDDKPGRRVEDPYIRKRSS